jgi:Protein of unknown function (DUF2846)
MQFKNSIRSVVIACLALVITGCASLPSPEAMKAETANYNLPALPEAGKAMVYVVRPSALGGIVRFNVFVDNQEDASEVGYTRSGQYIYFSLPVGEHKLYSKAENWAETAVDAKAGDIIFIQQEPHMGILLARNSLSNLHGYEGKYHVKTLTLGTILKSEK